MVTSVNVSVKKKSIKYCVCKEGYTWILNTCSYQCNKECGFENVLV